MRNKTLILTSTNLRIGVSFRDSNMARSLCSKGEACTDKQKSAVKKVKGPLVVVAGPGAGKTRVLVERVAYLVKRRGVSPGNILLITFTEKAASELKTRLIKCVGLDAELMQISTIHSFCSTLLRNHPDEHEFGAGFEILDEESQLMFLRTVFYEIGLNRYMKMGEVHRAIEFFNKCTENCIESQELIDALKREYPNHKEYQGIARCYGRYIELLKEQKKIDFPGLEKEAYILLKSSEKVLESVRKQYKYMMIDEYQDTSPIQEMIFRKIARRNSNICVVGDEDQSIYGFRGATPENFIRFRDEYDAEVVTLENNFRSRAGIVLTADSFMMSERHYEKAIKTCKGRRNRRRYTKKPRR